jgi:hypothetical protein
MGLPDNLESLSIEELQAMHDNMAAQVASSGASFEPASYPQRIAGGLATALSGGTFGLSDKLIEAASFDPQAREKLDFLKNQYAQSAGSGLTAATSIGGSLLTPVGQIGKAIGAPKAASAVLDYASKIPAGRFLAQRAVDFVPGAIMSGTAGYNNAPEGQELETAINDAIIGGGASMLLSPAARTLTGARDAGKAIEASQEAKALGLTSRDIAKSALFSGADDESTLIQQQVKQILGDAKATSAQSGDELFGNILKNRDKLSSQYDELMMTANKLAGKDGVKLTATDKKSVIDWINSDQVPTSDKKILKKLLDTTVKEFNETSGSSGNPFKQLMTDRTKLNKVYQEANPDSVDKLNKQLRKMFNAKLKASLGVKVQDSGVARNFGEQLSALDKAYAPYSALRSAIAKSKGKDVMSMSLDDALKSVATTGGMGSFIKTAFDKGGVLGGTAATAMSIPALMFARTPGGALQSAEAARKIGGAIGKVGDVGQANINKLVGNYAGSVGRSNKEFAKQKEIDAVLADIPDSDPAASKRDISFSQESLPPLIQAMISVESNKNPRAVSKAGAIGLMQLMPANAKKFGIDPLDPMQNIFGGMQILDEEMKRYKDPVVALAAYNLGSKKMNDAIKMAGTKEWRILKNFVPEETREYPAKVLAAMNKLETSTKG